MKRLPASVRLPAAATPLTSAQAWVPVSVLPISTVASHRRVPAAPRAAASLRASFLSRCHHVMAFDRVVSPRARRTLAGPRRPMARPAPCETRCPRVSPRRERVPRRYEHAAGRPVGVSWLAALPWALHPRIWPVMLMADRLFVPACRTSRATLRFAAYPAPAVHRACGDDRRDCAGCASCVSLRRASPRTSRREST